jgi:hypothetical protein
MTSIFSILTEATCGEACWSAKEDICRCSCGGKNHGISKRGGTAERTCKIDGYRYKLQGVGKHRDLINEAAAINEQIVISVHWNDGYRTLRLVKQNDKERGAPARVKYASQPQIDKWNELEIYRGLDRYHADAALLWVRTDIEELHDKSRQMATQDLIDLSIKVKAMTQAQRSMAWYETLYRMNDSFEELRAKYWHDLENFTNSKSLKTVLRSTAVTRLTANGQARNYDQSKSVWRARQNQKTKTKIGEKLKWHIN